MLDDLPGVRAALRGWYGDHRRDLPWRRTRDPYRIWVSEVMCQQTRVDTVVPFYERFLEAFPTVTALADAEPDHVLKHWAGLGYYRRCRNLHRGAQVVRDTWGGQVPHTLDGLRSLPGVGAYTAGAIASLAFGLPVAAVDGNVSRVLSRLLKLDEAIDTSSGKRALSAQAEILVDPEDAATHNQALMELGALVCTPTQPACPVCPLRVFCRAYAAGDPTRWPCKSPRRAPRPITGVAALARDARGRLLLGRRPEGGLLGGLWELPGGEVLDGEEERSALGRRLEERLGLQGTVKRHLGSVEHVFTHRRLSLQIYAVDLRGPGPRDLWYTGSRWLDPEDVGSVPLSTLTRKVLTVLGYASG